MDAKVLARKIRDAIFDQAETDGRVMHGDAMDAVIERVLAAHQAPPLYAVSLYPVTTENGKVYTLTRCD